MIFPSAAATRMRGPSCIDLPTADQDYSARPPRSARRPRPAARLLTAPGYPSLGSCAVSGQRSLSRRTICRDDSRTVRRRIRPSLPVLRPHGLTPEARALLISRLHGPRHSGPRRHTAGPPTPPVKRTVDDSGHVRSCLLEGQKPAGVRPVTGNQPELRKCLPSDSITLTGTAHNRFPRSRGSGSHSPLQGARRAIREAARNPKNP